MTGARLAAIVTRKSDAPNGPDHTITIIGIEVLIFFQMLEQGEGGITPRDIGGRFAVKHVRSLIRKGIGIEEFCGTYSDGRRYTLLRLTEAYSFEFIPYPKDRKPSCNWASNSNSDGESGGLNNE